MADGLLWLSQATDRNSVVRKLQVVKIRGRAPMPGLHTFRITDNGLQVFPRIPEQTRKRVLQQRRDRLSTGVAGMDEMLDGGIIAGAAVMLTGPAGSGKSTVATQFMSAGLANGETGVIAVFEEYPEEYLRRANARNPDVGKMIDAGKLALIYLRPLDLSVDEALFSILEAVDRLGAKRVVIDSLSGFEVALAPTFREDFRESLYRLVGTLTATGVTVFMTAEVSEAFAEARFTTEKVSFITDVIIVQRYVEMKGELKRVMAVVKMRGSNHSHEFRMYEVTAKGVVVGESLTEYDGILGGTPTLRAKVNGASPAQATVKGCVGRAGPRWARWPRRGEANSGNGIQKAAACRTSDQAFNPGSVAALHAAGAAAVRHYTRRGPQGRLRQFRIHSLGWRQRQRAWCVHRRRVHCTGGRRAERHSRSRISRRCRAAG